MFGYSIYVLDTKRESFSNDFEGLLAIALQVKKGVVLYREGKAILGIYPEGVTRIHWTPDALWDEKLRGAQLHPELTGIPIRNVCYDVEGNPYPDPEGDKTEYSLYWDETGREIQVDSFDYLLEVAMATLRNGHHHVTLRREGLAILVVRPMNEVRVHWTPDTTKAEKAFVVNANPSLKGIPTMPYGGEASEGPMIAFELGYTHLDQGDHVYREAFRARSWVKAALYAMEYEQTLGATHTGVRVTEIKLVQ